MDRRTFLVTLGRYSAASGIVGGAALLMARREGGGADFSCFKPVSCGECSIFGKCTLPKAVAVRESSGLSASNTGEGDGRRQ